MKNFNFIFLLGLGALIHADSAANVQQPEFNKERVDVYLVHNETDLIDLITSLTENTCTLKLNEYDIPLIGIECAQVLIPKRERVFVKNVKGNYKTPFVDTRWVWQYSMYYNC